MKEREREKREREEREREKEEEKKARKKRIAMKENGKATNKRKKRRKVTQIALFRGILDQSVNVDFPKAEMEGEEKEEEEEEEDERDRGRKKRKRRECRHWRISPLKAFFFLFSVVLKTKFLSFNDELRVFLSFH